MVINNEANRQQLTFRISCQNNEQQEALVCIGRQEAALLLEQGGGSVLGRYWGVGTRRQNKHPEEILRLLIWIRTKVQFHTDRRVCVAFMTEPGETQNTDMNE